MYGKRQTLPSPTATPTIVKMVLKRDVKTCRALGD